MIDDINGSSKQVEITIEFVEKSDTYEVFCQNDDEFFGAFVTLENAFTEAWNRCPEGGKISECNLSEDDWLQLQDMMKAAEAATAIDQPAPVAATAWNQPRYPLPRRSPITGHFYGGDRGGR